MSWAQNLKSTGRVGLELSKCCQLPAGSYWSASLCSDTRACHLGLALLRLPTAHLVSLRILNPTEDLGDNRLESGRRFRSSHSQAFWEQPDHLALPPGHQVPAAMSLLPGDTWQCPETFLVVTAGDVLAFSGQRPGML